MASFVTSNVRRRVLAAAIAHALVGVSLCAAAVPALATDTDAAAQPATAPADAQPAPAGQKEDAKHPAKKTVTLKEVTVTAQRRKQNLQQVPITVTAIDEAELNRRGITSISDLNAAAPGLVVYNNEYTDGSQVAIRGQYSVNPGMYWDTPVSVYVNGVYFGKAKIDAFSLPDMSRIEVLNGPQGTLYGRNTMGGAVNVITQKPSGVFTGTADVGFGRYGDKTAKAVVDLPAMGKLKVSVGAKAEKRAGPVKTTPGSSVGSLGKIDSRSAYVDMLLDATDDLTIEYRNDYAKSNNTAYFLQMLNFDLAIPGAVPNTQRQSIASVNGPEYDRQRTDSNALHVDWRLPVGTLKYIAGHSETHLNDGLDLDGTPVLIAQSEEGNRYRETSHELQYIGSVGRWNWVTGLYYFKDAGFNNNPQWYFFGAANYVPNWYAYGTRSRAAYGQVDYKLTDKLTITAGIRRTLDWKRVQRFEQLNGTVLIPATTKASAGFSATTPTLSVNYQLDEHHLIYGRYAKGYLSGNFNAEAATPAEVMAPFKPETAQTFEFGSKNSLLGGRMYLNADVFFNRVSNLQEAVFTATGAAASNVLNVGTSRSYGLEVQAKYQATEDLMLTANYSYMRGKFNKFMELGVNIANNTSFPLMPRNIFNLVADATLLRTTHGTLTGMLDYRYTSGYYLNAFQKTLVNPAAQLAGNTWIKPVGILNGRLAFGGMNWGNVTGEVSVYVNNIFNKVHMEQAIDFGPALYNLRTGTFNLPRTYGVNLRIDW